MTFKQLIRGVGYLAVGVLSYFGARLIVSALFGRVSAPPSERPIAADRKLTPEEIADKARAVCVLIECSWTEEDLTVDDAGGGSGTGVIVEADGGELKILTNLHVLQLENVAKADFAGGDAPELKHYGLSVTFSNGQSAKVRRLMVNPHLKDFAVLEVNRAGWKRDLLPLSKDVPRQGSRVFAMGNPHGLKFTFTQGTISGHRRYASPSGQPCDLLQTDTAINPGNSGGPLLDEYARIVGINTLTLGRDSGAQGLNCAITSEEIVRSGLQDGWTELPTSARQLGQAAYNLFQSGTRK